MTPPPLTAPVAPAAPPTTLGARIRERRRTLGMTASALAVAVGVSDTTIGNYQTGLTKPSPGILGRIAEALGCSVDELVSMPTVVDLAQVDSPMESPPLLSAGAPGINADAGARRKLGWFREHSPDAEIIKIKPYSRMLVRFTSAYHGLMWGNIFQYESGKWRYAASGPFESMLDWYCMQPATAALATAKRIDAATKGADA